MSKWVWIALGALVLFSGGNAVVNTVENTIIDKLATAIATAEGFFVAGSRPARDNNPGDLELDVIGRGIGKDGPYIVYATPDDGWAALKHQVALMFGGSHIYTPLMTIAEVASHYTTTEVASWAQNVADVLGVSVNTRLIDLV